jgi:prevent-host-death family protein
MGEATVRQLRNQGGAVIERVLAGEHVTITRDGEAVAELLPLRRRPVHRDVLVEEFTKLPSMDPAALRADIDAILDQSL